MQQSITQLNKYIEKHKLRHSTERVKVLEEIIAMNSRFTTLSLYESINTHYPISKAAVYNIINFLLDASIIIRHPLPGRDVQYEATTRAVTHHIRICNKCGMVKEFTDQKISRTTKMRKFTTFHTQFHMVYLYGICKKCMTPKERKQLISK
ncbi:MAG: transcriptional repressor [bacterium]